MNGAIHLAQGAPVYGFFDQGRQQFALWGWVAGWGAGHAAPTELERRLGGGVTKNMSLLRSWLAAGL